MPEGLSPAQRLVIERNDELREALRGLHPTLHSDLTPFGAAGPLCFYEQGVYSANFTEQRVEFTFDYVDIDHGDIWAELDVSDLIHQQSMLRTRVNLLKGNTRRDASKELQNRSNGTAMDWTAMLEMATRWVVDRVREGQPEVVLSDVEPMDEQATYLFEPVVISEGTTLLFGPGGSMKSYLALAIALSLHTGTEIVAGMPPAKQMRVAYLDWEWNERVHSTRMRSITDQPNDMVYMRGHLPIDQERDRIRHLIRRRSIDLLVIDSIGKSATGEIETSRAANDYFNMVEYFERPAVLIGHVTKQDRKNGESETTYGSIFWENNARAAWFLKLIEGTPSRIGFYHTKHNLTKQQRSFSVEADGLEGGSLSLRKGDVVEDPQLSKRLPIKARLMAILKHGAVPLYEIAQELDVSNDAVKMALLRGSKGDRPLFVKVNGPDGIYRWGLASR